MMGSPFYYDVLFDDGPGDVVFHDCMWSGICTCCIQLLHQDSFYYTNDSPDLKVDLMYQQQQQQQQHQHHHHHQQQQHQQHHHHHQQPQQQPQHQNQQQHQNQLQQQQITIANKVASIFANSSSNNNHHHHHHNHHHHLDSALNSSTCNSPVTASSLSSISSNNSNTSDKIASLSSISSNNNSNTSDRTAPNFAPCSSSTSISPDHASTTLSASASPDTPSSLSPKPVRRREHNDSERKRRDHLRNAFNFLRDQVPRFKAINKKPPRIQILHEATLYVQRIMKESEELERRLADEKSKHERLKNH